MKKLTLTIVLTLFTILFSFGQDCLPEGINFNQQEQIDNFQTNYPGCTEIEGDVEIWFNITNLEGLNVITSIYGDLIIMGNWNLINLTGLENLTMIGGTLEIGDHSGDYINSELTSLEGMENLTTVGGSVIIAGNPVLATLTGLENLTLIGENLTIGWPHQAGNPELTTVEALANLSTVGGNVRIFNNPMLTSLEGFDNLSSIPGGLSIANNGITNLMGFVGLNSLGGGLYIGAYYCSTLELISLEGLENLTSIGGVLSIRRHINLTSLEGLENIDAGSIEEIEINGNLQLSVCDIQSICDYLAAPNGTVTIENNDNGCNSQEEVEEACEEITNIEDPEEIKFTIYPNPTDNGIITITLDNPDNLHMKFFNTFGQQVYQQQISSVETLINISTWSPGIYLAVVYEQGKAVGRIKFIVR